MPVSAAIVSLFGVLVKTNCTEGYRNAELHCLTVLFQSPVVLD